MRGPAKLGNGMGSSCSDFAKRYTGISLTSSMSLPTIFQTCRPRADVLAGTIRDDEFMADLSRVVNGTAPPDYLDPAAFFAKSYPTRGMKELLKAVCLRLSGKGG